MALRNIMLYNQDDVLRKKSRIVERTSPGIKLLLDDMFDTMYHANGVGLAAPQVGILRRVVVIDTGEETARLINPKIMYSEGEQTGQEGCLSIPNITGVVKRPEFVIVSAINENGEKIELYGSGLIARAFCHEIDHLDGVLFIDRAEPGSLRRAIDANGKIIFEPAEDILL